MAGGPSTAQAARSVQVPVIHPIIIVMVMIAVSAHRI